MSSSKVNEIAHGEELKTTPACRGGPTATLVAAIAVVLMAGCAAPHRRAPVEDLKAVPARSVAAASGASAPSEQPSAETALQKPPLPGSENAGKPGYYTVKPLDTLIRIGLDTGQSWRDLVKWNNLDNPNIIEVGQVLRILPPGVDATAIGSRPVAANRVEARPLGTPPPATATSQTPAAAILPPQPVVAALVPTPRDADDSVNWAWPSSAPVGAGFDEARNKGLAFYGKAGDPVYASADGRVMYAGAGLPGYGNLVILKHNSNYLTAYAHNQTLLVKEDQPVHKGQKIAEMGSTDAERVELHFEIRKQGKPVDPAKLLPAR